MAATVAQGGFSRLSTMAAEPRREADAEQRLAIIDALLPLALTVKGDWDVANQVAYARALAGVSVPLLYRAVDLMMQNPEMVWMPSVPEIRGYVERAEREVRAAHPYEGCVDCEDSRGWVTVKDVAGVPRQTPCPCRRRHRAKLAELGVGPERKQLPAGVEA